MLAVKPGDNIKIQALIKLQALIAAFREYNERNNTPFATLSFFDDLSGVVQDESHNTIAEFRSLDELLTLLME